MPACQFPLLAFGRYATFVTFVNVFRVGILRLQLISAPACSVRDGLDVIRARFQEICLPESEVNLMRKFGGHVR